MTMVGKVSESQADVLKTRAAGVVRLALQIGLGVSTPLMDKPAGVRLPYIIGPGKPNCQRRIGMNRQERNSDPQRVTQPSRSWLRLWRFHLAEKEI
jgi:hypothetical protein